MRVCGFECLYGAKCAFGSCVRGKGRPAAGKMRIMDETAGLSVKPDGHGLGLAVDVGTTTVAACLIDLESAGELGGASCVNSQTAMGADVISRIGYAKNNGVSALNRAVTGDINALGAELLKRAGGAWEDITRVAVAGNTVMLHLLAGLSPEGMGAYPFEPASRFGVMYSGGQLGLNARRSEVYLIDCVSAFAGGDVVAAILASGMCEAYKTCLLMDIGTNGEIALGARDGVYVTSAAAGPAFEGGLSCGMAGVSGAVSGVLAHDGELGLAVIGGGEPLGFCGSGILDAAAFMLEASLMDESGRIAGEAPLPFKNMVFEDEKRGRYVQFARGVELTQLDVRALQGAKAAMRAGAQRLIQVAGAEGGDISRVYLAGGFGSYMNARSAAAVGLISAAWENRLVMLKNASLSGACMAVLSEKRRDECAKIALCCKHVELSGDKAFADAYIEYMRFSEN